METGNIMLALSNDNNSIIPKKNVTPPECIVLQAFHGAGAIRKLEVCKTPSNRGNDQEYARLKMIYGNSKNSDGKLVFMQVFPSPYDIKWPTTFDRVIAKNITSELQDVKEEEKAAGYKEVELMDGYVHLEKASDAAAIGEEPMMAMAEMASNSNDFDMPVFDEPKVSTKSKK